MAEALSCWSARYSDAEIGRRMGVAERTVEHWRERLGVWHTQDTSWYTSGEAARVTGLRPQRLTRMARAGRIRAQQRGGRGCWWLFAPEDVERLALTHNPALMRRWEEHRRWSH
jgi:hypothetical protein